MVFGSFDGIKDDDCKGTGFVEIFNIFESQDDFFVGMALFDSVNFNLQSPANHT